MPTRPSTRHDRTEFLSDKLPLQEIDWPISSATPHLPGRTLSESDVERRNSAPSTTSKQPAPKSSKPARPPQYPRAPLRVFVKLRIHPAILANSSTPTAASPPWKSWPDLRCRARPRASSRPETSRTPRPEPLDGLCWDNTPSSPTCRPRRTKPSPSPSVLLEQRPGQSTTLRRKLARRHRKGTMIASSATTTRKLSAATPSSLEKRRRLTTLPKRDTRHTQHKETGADSRPVPVSLPHRTPSYPETPSPD
jgi:hypothetical protein